uniref:Cathepsin propeptide inhibitor domain-containing protein n=1 Tax=Alexandrium monilatum TaxID=311494 RepID=A0A7S4PUI4_9DINO
MVSEALEAQELDKKLQSRPVENALRLRFKRYERACVAAILLGALFVAGTAYVLQQSYRTASTLPRTSAAAELRAFEAWASEHGRQYATPEEREVRLAIFRINFRRVQSENARGHSFKLALNEFADRTSEDHGQPGNASWGHCKC